MRDTVLDRVVVRKLFAVDAPEDRAPTFFWIRQASDALMVNS